MPTFVGLDGEMTNSSIELGELCQIGIATTDGDVFCSDIRCTLEGADPEAMAVHAIDPCWLQEAAPRLPRVDSDAAYFLQQMLGRANKAVPVGWGVSYFDMPWVRKYLPRTAEYLSRRSVELGSVCYSIAATFGKSPDTLKRRAKRWAKERATDPHTWHNAGFDAQCSLLAWEYLMKVMREGDYV